MDLMQWVQQFSTDEACRRWLEHARWPNGPVCPRCRAEGRASRLSTRPQWTCLECRHRYSVTSGTPMHRTKLPLQTWLVAMYLLAGSAKGVSALRLAGMLGVTYRTAWHLSHRIRAMMKGDAAILRGIVEVDETYVGGKPRKIHRERTLPGKKRPRRKQGRGTRKACVFVGVERGGRAGARVVSTHDAITLGGAVRACVDDASVLVTDELPAYKRVDREYAVHLSVRHSRDEYARTCKETGVRVHTNTAEGFNATLKRAIFGIFHHVSRKHLHRYVTEATFRWNARRSSAPERLKRLNFFASPLPYGTLVA